MARSDIDLLMGALPGRATANAIRRRIRHDALGTFALHTWAKPNGAGAVRELAAAGEEAVGDLNGVSKVPRGVARQNCD